MRLKRSIITVLGTAGLLAAGGCGSGDTAGSSPTQQSTAPRARYECTTANLQPSVGPVQLTAGGLCSYDDGLGRVTYGLTVRNNGDEVVHEVLVDVDVHDSTGVNAGRAVPHFVFELQPGEETGIGYFSLVQGTPEGMAEGRLLGVNITVPEVTYNPCWAEGNIAVSDVSTVLEGGVRSTSFALSSTYDFAVAPVEVFVVYRDETGAIVGGEQDQIDHMDPHGTVAHTINSEYVNPAVTQAAVFVNDNPEPPEELRPRPCPSG